MPSKLDTCTSFVLNGGFGREQIPSIWDIVNFIGSSSLRVPFGLSGEVLNKMQVLKMQLAVSVLDESISLT